ncbi:MAG: aldehyde dehydrogenase [Candidatus Omnitrophica bacterium]|nr:aldehyde dehydrogenase [Candidatus Omnitrophota bacterium]
MKTYPLYINGEFIQTKVEQEVINPATGEIIARASIASAAEIEAVLSSSRQAFDHGEWPRLSFAERKEFILKINQGILDQARELAELETLNTGKPIKETTFMDIPSSAKTFEHIAQNFEKYLSAQTIKVEDAECLLAREPMGVVVLIVPWNYPLLIASWKLASALAAGNTVILKPSSLTPLTALELAKIIDSAGLPKGAVNIINAGGDKIGSGLCSDKRVDMISFTGSNPVGRQIMGYSGQNSKKLIMELGGKSAAIILKDADLEVAVNGSLCSSFLNQGQMCTQMSRIFVQEDIYDKFIADFTAKAKRIKLGAGLDFQAQMGPLISAGQREKALAYVEKAKEQGAKLLCGGRIPQDNNLKQGFFFEPAVLADVRADMPIFQEEIFAPVVCVNKFSTSEEAVSLANKSDFGLACCIWSGDERLAQQVAAKINAGIIWINTYGMFYNQVPYGGFKQSGFGKELGKEGFLEYTRLKSVITDRSAEKKPLVNYWYAL